MQFKFACDAYKWKRGRKKENLIRQISVIVTYLKGEQTLTLTDFWILGFSFLLHLKQILIELLVMKSFNVLCIFIVFAAPSLPHKEWIRACCYECQRTHLWFALPGKLPLCRWAIEKNLISKLKQELELSVTWTSLEASLL